jgi:hypothetical protein
MSVALIWKQTHAYEVGLKAKSRYKEVMADVCILLPVFTLLQSHSPV